MAKEIHPTEIKGPLSYEPDYRGTHRDEVYPIKDADGRTIGTSSSLAAAVMLVACFNLVKELVPFLRYPVVPGLQADRYHMTSETIETMLADFERECAEWERYMKDREEAREAERKAIAVALDVFNYGDAVMVKFGHPRAGAVGRICGVHVEDKQILLVVDHNGETGAWASKGFYKATDLQKI